MELWSDKEILAPHELGDNITEGVICGKLKPHRSDDWRRSLSSLYKHGVQIVDERIPREDRFSDRNLDSLASQPRLPILREVEISM